MANSRDFFTLHPVFTSSQFAEFLRHRHSLSTSTRNSLLRHHERRGHIARVRRGLYTTLTATPPSRPVADRYAIATAAAPDAVLALGSAVEWWSGRTPDGGTVWFYTRTACRQFEFAGTTFRPVRPFAWEPEVLTVERDGVAVHITTLERAVVDLLDRLEFAGGWEAACRALRDVPSFDAKRAVNYVLGLNRAAAAAKVGCFLESRPDSFPDVLRCRLLAASPKSPHYVDGRGRGGRYIRQWNLIVPSVD